MCTTTFFSGVTQRGHGHRVSATSISRNTEYKKPETLLVELTAGKKIYHQGRKHKDVFDISSPLYSHSQHALVGHATWWPVWFGLLSMLGGALNQGFIKANTKKSRCNILMLAACFPNVSSVQSVTSHQQLRLCCSYFLLFRTDTVYQDVYRVTVVFTL